MESKDQQDRMIYRNVKSAILARYENDALENTIADEWETLCGEMGDAIAGDEDGLISWCNVARRAAELGQWATEVSMSAGRACERERTYRHVKRDFPETVGRLESEIW